MSSLNQSINQSDQGTSSFNKLCATGGSLIIVLLTLLQVRYGNKEASPFETHRLVMMLFIVTMVINTLVAVAAITVEAWFTNHSLVPVLKLMFIAFGVLACDLLLLILAPPVGYLFLVIWALLLLLALLYYVLITLALHQLPNYAVYQVQNLYQKYMVRRPQAPDTPPTARTSVGRQDGFGDISIEMNAEVTVP